MINSDVSLFELAMEFLRYDPDTGVFTWNKSNNKRIKIGAIAGCVQHDYKGKKYISIRLSGKLYKSHRLAWVITYGELPDSDIDHINGDGLDNRVINLRSVSHQENMKNQKLRNTNKSGICGVFLNKPTGKWQVQITVDGKKKHLGLFSDFDSSVAARKAADISHGYHQNHGSSSLQLAGYA